MPRKYEKGSQWAEGNSLFSGEDPKETGTPPAEAQVQVGARPGR